MYDNSGSVLGAATATIVLPATASAITGINYFILLASFVAVLILFNVVVKIVKNTVKL